MVIGGLTVESVAMFAVSFLLFIFLVACIVCLYCAHRFNKVMNTPHCREADQQGSSGKDQQGSSGKDQQGPTSARFNDTENEPIDDIKTLRRSLTSRPSRKLKVIVEHHEERNSSIAEL